MTLGIESVTFNHDVASSSTSALNIRRNRLYEVLVPEWDSTRNARPAPQDSPAAYGIAETRRQNVFVRVRFTRGQADPAAYVVRATGGGVLGALDARGVTFPGKHTSVEVDFPLSHRTFDRVLRQDVVWIWAVRSMAVGGWSRLAGTEHRIYVLLKAPSEPWSQTPAALNNPWTDLLDFSCAVASGSRTDAAATAAITKDVHQNHGLRYDIVKGGPSYTWRVFPDTTHFELTNWITAVLKPFAGPTAVFCAGTAEQYKWTLIVNCDDCAAACATMARVVGADAQLQLHDPFGYLRYVEPIGRGKANNPAYGCSGGIPAVGPDDPRTSFAYHAYQKLGARTYDACMREWVPPMVRALLIALCRFTWFVTFGLLDCTRLRDRADGWLVDLDQADYEARTIDRSQPFEAAAATGGPVPRLLQIF